MIKFSEIVGLPVICAEDGSKEGNISDMVFCPEDKYVKGLILDRADLSLIDKAILFEDILSLGKDAVVITNCDSIHEVKSQKIQEVIQQRGNIIDLRIYTNAGEDIGIVNDILIDEKTGKVEGIVVSDGFIKDLFEGRSLLPLQGKVTIGKECLLVEKEAVEEMIDSEKGLKNIIV